MEPFDSPSSVPGPRDWRNAPKVVKGWAYQLTWLGILLAVLGIVIVPTSERLSAAEKLFGVLFYVALLALNIWLNRAMKKGTPAAWMAQFILSVLGLLAFPLGTLINGYILSQWFKPESR